MQTMKSFTDGLAILLAILILIYALTLYAKFNPNETKIENGESKLIQFIKNANTNRDHLRMLFVTAMSALAGFLFRKRPEISGAFAIFAMSFIMTLCENKQLTKYPNVIIILILGHLAGNMVYSAFYDIEYKTKKCTVLSIIGSIGALAISTVCAVYQKIILSTSDMVKELTEANVELSDKIKFVPDAIRLIYRKFIADGAYQAREMTYSLESQISFDTMKTKFIDDIVGEQYTVYLRFALLVFASIILTIAFSKKYRFIGAIVSAIPFIYEFVMIQTEQMSCLALPLLTLTLFSAIMNITSVLIKDCKPNSVEDKEEYEENVTEETTSEDPDEIQYT